MFNEFEADLLDQIATAAALFDRGQFLFGRRQDALQPDERHVIDQIRADRERAAAHVFFFETNNRLTDFGFEFSFGFRQK